MKATIEEIIIRYLEGEATLAEQDELLSWLRESKEHERMFLVYYDVWSLPRQLAFDPQVALKKIYPPQRRSRKPVIWWTASIAASVAILFGVWFLMDNQRPETADIRYVVQQYNNKDIQPSETEDIRLILSDEKEVAVKDKTETTITYLDSDIEIDEEQSVSKTEAAEFNQLITPYGKRGTLVLEDGTKIWLNANSRLVYPTHFTGDSREVFVQGEIYLEVSPNKNRPFIVRTERMNVEVLGTSFAVSAYKQELHSRVILASGAVNVYSEEHKRKKQALSPNQMYELSASGEAKVAHVPDVTKYTSWINGIYQFESESLSSILHLMERFYGRQIELADEAGVLTCSGKLRLNDNFNRTLQGLSQTLPIHIEIKDNKYYISKIAE
jgi:ferric-dicitrate binding protein FerR (iron transport regulator)